ncbi:hypothetical protein AAVH_17125 [Aphelenchoides avenae]|nr:hypothetical protein AAVH_17125 [Aphelenchus avenae]
MLLTNLESLFDALLVVLYAEGKPFSANAVEKAGMRDRPTNRFLLKELLDSGASKSQAYRDALEFLQNRLKAKHARPGVARTQASSYQPTSGLLLSSYLGDGKTLDIPGCLKCTSPDLAFLRRRFSRYGTYNKAPDSFGTAILSI